ncbi:DUF664 domain-containing protein [Streptomyces sp. H10-C2]|uniref:mycothiol transferase n=1 Tax=unclassified Streptomyces TaxID=2593676 RepID=UPI0024B9555F|nr:MULTISPECIES: DUF664 domain-containing protein [unclassified Streptomyces]MDJ0344740.1 DUF664 domain-containing protein [Streptomyces sp. PH10-H1]MDJ0371231.1 DUF664 domain-containing protein [Streptomyces sp. H10-C2]
MNTGDLLADAFGRIQENVHSVVDGLSPEELALRLDGRANSIVWLVWHLTRVQDDHVADAAGSEQIWTSQGWSDRFELPFAARSTGYGHTSKQVTAVGGISSELLTGYHDAVHEHTSRYVRGLKAADLDRIVDEGWTPPVTLGVRLVSVISDDLQHVGQAAFVRGVLRRR